MLRVVSAAIREGSVRHPGFRFLAARRPAGKEFAGAWEFPGGKVEPGETDRAALARECREELGVVIVVREPIGGPQRYDPPLVLTSFELVHYAASVVSGNPSPLASTEVRWCSVWELARMELTPGTRWLVDTFGSRLTA